MTTEDDETTAKEAAPETDEKSSAAAMQASVETIVMAIVAAIKATSLRPPPERVVVEETPEADEPGVRKFDEADETPDYETKHTWQKIHDRLTCNKCQALWTETNEDLNCAIAEGERALTQLGGCLLAAEGQATGTPGGTPGATKGDYGWSPAFQAVRDLWDEGDRLRMSLEHCRQATMANFDADLLQATGEEGVELYAFTAIRELRDGYDDANKELKAERAANADKVQIIDRQCQERRAIRTAVAIGDMAELSKILFPPESDEPESVEEPETKTVVLDMGPDHLKIVEIANVTALRDELDRIKEGYANARNEISRRVSCTCISQGGEWAGPHLWTCPLGILYRTFDELMAPGSSTPGAELPKFRNKTGKEKR